LALAVSELLRSWNSALLGAIGSESDFVSQLRTDGISNIL